VTGGTARTSRPGPSDSGQVRALDVLRLAWGEVYDTGFADSAYRAARIEGTGDLLTGQTPEELNAAIRAEWNARSSR
jgi:hypothetical protein